jgi:hypothetical protein
MGLFRKDRPRPSLPPEPPPNLSDADLADASRLMDRWDAVLGNSDAMWSCLEAIAVRGGFRGPQATLMEVMDGRSSADVTQRPWRWWREAAGRAHATGQHGLAGRIFLFTHLFATQTVRNMRAGDMLETGLDAPATATYQQIAATAVHALALLPPELLIHDTATGKVDVANALRMAEEVSGLTAPAGPEPGHPKPFNAL